MSQSAYARAGVDIEAGDRAVELMKSHVARATRPEVMGGLGGFILPPLFAYTKAWTGFPTSTFFVLFLVTLVCAA